MQNNPQPEEHNTAPQHDENNTMPMSSAQDIPQAPDFYSEHTVPFPQGFNASGSLPPQPQDSFPGQTPVPGQTPFPGQGPVPGQAPMPQYQAPMPGAAPQPAQPGAFAGAQPPATVQPAQKRPNRLKLLIGGAIVLVIVVIAIIGFTFIPSLINQNAQAGTSTPIVQQSPVATTKATKKNIYTPYLNRYKATIREQIAQGLNLSSTQLGDQLTVGQTLQSIASKQGVSSTQLQTIIKDAFQKAFQPAVDNSQLTQKQVTTLITRMIKQPQTLDRYLANKAKGTNGSQPAATATANANQA